MNITPTCLPGGPVLRAHGITLLENEAAVLPVRGSHLTVAGVTDNVAGRFGLPGPDPHRALEGTPRPRILMAHKPELFHETAPEIDLQLSGHTHGGLALLLDQGVALFNGGFVRGWYARDDARPVCGPRQRPVGRFSPAPGRAFRDPAAGPARAAVTHRPPNV